MINRDRFMLLCQVCAELQEAGVQIDPGQLEWAVRQIEAKVWEASLDKQYRYEQQKNQWQREQQR